MADPYKDHSREELLAECIKLRDEMGGMTKKANKPPRIFRRWHAALSFISVSFVSLCCGAYCTQATIDAGKMMPLYIAPAIFSGMIAIVLFIWSINCVTEDKLTDRFLDR